MQKKIIALAVAGLVSGVAFAQSNVTVYGVVDANYTYSKGPDYKWNGIDDGGLSGSRIGFKGEEALGNGLKAVFTLEYGTRVDDRAPDAANGALTNARQSFVGLSGNFGSVTAGRQYAPSYMYIGGSVASDVTSVYPTNMYYGQMTTVQTGGGSRWDNSIVYQSPVWSGFDFRAIYAFGEQSGTNAVTPPNKNYDLTDSNRYGIGAKYSNGPVYLMGVYQAIMDDDTVGSTGNKGWSVGGAYDFKVVKLFANYTREKDNAAAARKETLWSLGVGIPVSSAGTVNVEYAQYKNNNLADENKSKGFGVGYVHNMSKRTTLYGTISRISNDDRLALGGFGNSARSDLRVNGIGAVNAIDGGNVTNLQLGIRHSF